MARKLAIIALVALTATLSLLQGRPTAASQPADVRGLTHAFPVSALSPGALDPTFDGDGKVITDFEGGAYDVGNGVAVQGDGKILVAGETQSAADDSFAIVRYKADGGLDPSFDGDGKVRTDFTSTSREWAEDGAVQPDGKFVAAGVVSLPATASDFALVRYNPDGTLDASFSEDGKVATDFSAISLDWAFAVTIQPDGRIVAAGSSRWGPPGARRADVAVARYNGDGSPDSSFDGDGRVVTSISPGLDAFAMDLVIQPDGKLVVGGYGQDRLSGAQSTFLMRYTAAGSLDTSFDGDGVVLTTETGYGLALQRDGKIVTAGSHGFGVARFNSNGSLDVGFGEAGHATAPFEGSAGAVALQPDGKIVAGGSGAGGHNFAVARFQTSGNPDTTFGSGGVAETVLGGPAGSDMAWDVAIAPGGKIVLAGMSRPTSDGPFDFAVVRYIGELPPCKVPNVRGRKLSAARSAITKARCRVGKVSRKASKKVRRGRVISQSPKARTSLPNLGKVNLVVSRGRR